MQILCSSRFVERSRYAAKNQHSHSNEQIIPPRASPEHDHRTHSWSTVKVGRNGLQFFYQHVLKKDWVWVDIVKPPRKKPLPDIITLKEIERLINGTRELRYQTFILVAFSMGLRLGEALNLRVGDIDGDRMKVHIRQGKGRKDRFVTLPGISLQALRRYWVSHRNPSLISPPPAAARKRESGPPSPTDKRINRLVARCVSAGGTEMDIATVCERYRERFYLFAYKQRQLPGLFNNRIGRG